MNTLGETVRQKKTVGGGLVVTAKTVVTYTWEKMGVKWILHANFLVDCLENAAQQ